MRRLIGSLLATSMILGAEAHAAASATIDTTIVQMAIYRSAGNLVFIRVSGTPSPVAECQTSQAWQYVLSMDDAVGKQIYAMLLSAKAADKHVTLSGTGSCTQGVESLDGMYILQ